MKEIQFIKDKKILNIQKTTRATLKEAYKIRGHYG